VFQWIHCYYLVTSSYLCFSITILNLDVLFWAYHYTSHYVYVTPSYIYWHTIGSYEKNKKMKYGDTRFLPVSEIMHKAIASILKSREVICTSKQEILCTYYMDCDKDLPVEPVLTAKYKTGTYDLGLSIKFLLLSGRNVFYISFL